MITFHYPPREREQSLANEGGRDVSFFRFREREREREFWKFRETWLDQLGLNSFSLDPPLSNLASAMAVGVPFFLTFMLAKYSLSLSVSLIFDSVLVFLSYVNNMLSFVNMVDQPFWLWNTNIFLYVKKEPILVGAGYDSYEYICFVFVKNLGLMDVCIFVYYASMNFWGKGVHVIVIPLHEFGWGSVESNLR